MVTFRLGTSLLVPPNVKVALELAAPSGFHFQEEISCCCKHMQTPFQPKNALSPHFMKGNSKTLQPYNYIVIVIKKTFTVNWMCLTYLSCNASSTQRYSMVLSSLNTMSNLCLWEGHLCAGQQDCIVDRISPLHLEIDGHSAEDFLKLGVLRLVM